MASPIHTILVATDFGAAAEAALDRALALARELGASVVLFHAFEPPAPSSGAGVQVSIELTRHVLDAVHREIDRVLASRAEARVPIRAIVEEGEPARAVLEVAQREKADLIVLGTHGRGPVMRWLLGSVAASVVRTSVTPVLTVHTAPPSIEGTDAAHG